MVGWRSRENYRPITYELGTIMAHDSHIPANARLHLDNDGGWIFGVCAGLAQYWRTDPAIVRVGTIVSALFFPKIVIAAYLVGWLILDKRSA